MLIQYLPFPGISGDVLLSNKVWLIKQVDKLDVEFSDGLS